MNTTQLSYLVFGVVLLLAIGFDLGLLSKKGSPVTIRKALWQTVFWVMLAFAFFGFIWFERGHTHALEYISAYLMEWSLSIDNIFVFILIFTYFQVKEQHTARVLLIGILLAIVFRILFITAGVALVARFEWVLYIFGGILVITGIKIFAFKKQNEFDPQKNIVYRWMKKVLPVHPEDTSGKFIVRENGKRFFTGVFVVVVLLATADIVFALDSIPAVFAISQEKLVIYTSNIFAVLGLRSLFFLLQGAVNRFEYLQQGIAIILIFIGGKMLAEVVHIHIPVWVSLMIIVLCLTGSIMFSLQKIRKIKNGI
ncbi:MAG TPA: TerC/Alx family metal homeostasis membrane protein [Chitinophagaceae bacterium]|nr:TerC/Alx family metal homeostasis membrane protein [Chitinophagaceae bacterium]